MKNGRRNLRKSDLAGNRPINIQINEHLTNFTYDLLNIRSVEHLANQSSTSQIEFLISFRSRFHPISFFKFVEYLGLVKFSEEKNLIKEMFGTKLFLWFV